MVWGHCAGTLPLLLHGEPWRVARCLHVDAVLYMTSVTSSLADRFADVLGVTCAVLCCAVVPAALQAAWWRPVQDPTGLQAR